MESRAHRHGEAEHCGACDCAAHRDGERVQGKGPGAPGGLLSAVLPLVACSVCPACLATYAKVLALAGVGFGVTAKQHDALLAIAIAVSVAMSAWRSWRARRVVPVAIALAGSALLLSGHFLGEISWLEWSGVAILAYSGLGERLRIGRFFAASQASRA